MSITDDNCVPLDGATFCDPNQPDSFVPTMPARMDIQHRVQVYTAPPQGGLAVVLVGRWSGANRGRSAQSNMWNWARLTGGRCAHSLWSSRNDSRIGQWHSSKRLGEDGNFRPTVELTEPVETVTAGERFSVSAVPRTPTVSSLNIAGRFRDVSCPTLAPR